METLRDARPLLDDQFDALAHAERRRLLVSLVEADRRGDAPIAVEALTDDAESVERRISLRHNHLPKLEDRGFVGWDQENSRVTKGPQFEAIEPLLALLSEHRDELPGL